MHPSCELEDDIVETHLCKLCVVFRSRVFLGVTSLRIFFFFFFLAHIYFPASGQAVVTGVNRSSPRFLPSLFIAHRVQQSHCSSIFRRALLTHALAFSASQFVRKKKSPRIYKSMHSRRFELTKLPYTKLEDNLIRHRGEGIGRRLTLGSTV